MSDTYITEQRARGMSDEDLVAELSRIAGLNNEMNCQETAQMLTAEVQRRLHRAKSVIRHAYAPSVAASFAASVVDMLNAEDWDND